MISKEKEQKLISIYFFVCDLYEKELFHTSQRFSNKANPEFTDQEIRIIYLFTGWEQRYFSIKEIYSFAKEYLFDWFPKLPGYKAFSARVNLLASAFQFLAVYLIVSFKPKDCSPNISLLDSMPVFTCTLKNRVGKVAPQLTAKGYCASKGKYYYGCKLHALTAPPSKQSKDSAKNSNKETKPLMTSSLRLFQKLDNPLRLSSIG